MNENTVKPFVAELKMVVGCKRHKMEYLNHLGLIEWHRRHSDSLSARQQIHCFFIRGWFEKNC